MSEPSASRERPLSAVFAYGTLKQGQCRQNSWPRHARHILPGTVRGALWDLGPYPGLTVGDDVVCGEVYVFDVVDMPAVLTTLDQVEGYADQSHDLFRRQEVEAKLENGDVLTVWIYFYARTLLSTARRMQPDAKGMVAWP